MGVEGRKGKVDQIEKNRRERRLRVDRERARRNRVIVTNLTKQG